MKRRSIILIAIMIIVPMAALIWATLRISENEQVVVRQRFQTVFEHRLQDVNGNVSTFFEEAERDLARITAIDEYDLAELRNINRSEPRLLQLFVLNSAGELNYPDPMEAESPLSGNERMFLIEAAKMFTGQDLREAVLRAEQVADGNRVPEKPTAVANSRSQRIQQTPQYVQTDEGQQSTGAGQIVVQDTYLRNRAQILEQFSETSGWFMWYWDRGVNLIYWQRRPSGHIVGGALDRARWMADLISQLPDTVDGNESITRSLETRVRLVNTAGTAVYQWGNYEPKVTERPFSEIPVAAPLSSWRLQSFVPVEQLTAGTGKSATIVLLAVLGAVAATLGVCAFFVVREYSRDMREASQQVSFVNQVSHELKTPLTNIRMYAELLDSDLDKVDSDDAEKPRERLSVILSEGQRLSRLIGNVLSFARQKRNTLQLQPREEKPGRLVRQIVDRFRPAFADQQIEIQLECDDESLMSLDPDFLEQILGNLISNVEKYAATGGLLTVESQVSDDVLTIDVRDSGPGIQVAKRDIVFEPFARISNDVSYAAGTGIGLSIARELARLHGGDLVLMECNKGCWFRATLTGMPR